VTAADDASGNRRSGRARSAAAALRSVLKVRTRYRNAAARRTVVRHHVVVRFSLRLNADWARKAYGDDAGREEWFAMRARLFRATAVASLEAQTVAPRQVLVLLDVGDRDLWDRHLDLAPPFVGVFVEPDEAQAEVARRVLADGSRHVLLSRLDSDDAVEERYLERLGATAREARRLGRRTAWVVACEGFVTDLARVQGLYYNCSPFLALYAGRYRGENVYALEHETVLERDPLLNRTARWMQVVHGSNVANRLRRESRFAPGDARVMDLGPTSPVEKGWPRGFPPGLLAEARAVVRRA
jgi:hypothetical protein